MGKLTNIKQQLNIVFGSKFLKNLSSAERYEFLQLCHKRNYKEGEYVFYRNDPGTGMYFIQDGKIELMLNANNEETIQPDDSSKFILDAPDSFGALSIGYNLRRKATAQCVTDCQLLGFFQPDFEVLRDRHPQIAVKFLQSLTNIALRQLEKATYIIEEVAGQEKALQIQFDTYYENSED
ncbi:MAG: cyclic nucleotide-binding domain-containing protein [Balneola sp.]|nr:cyclic nucleotide-binding domain-containing protein [Balneola sp.]MBO6652176.1 cyclic nucleotide-binding domain-containing protein [Balneola sp.]MBO6710697.1 cyclic nucleotide-binding domain-containing protein [Balneola sp.]MBO6799383.1 cyclic nucleotide-binding domain-containing protein [Balneola sp.]MBO6869488.1 cyclic nucleotide-binding domain-containing protein [Balneola sp.]